MVLFWLHCSVPPAQGKPVLHKLAEGTAAEELKRISRSCGERQDQSADPQLVSNQHSSCFLSSQRAHEVTAPASQHYCLCMRILFTLRVVILTCTSMSSGFAAKGAISPCSAQQTLLLKSVLQALGKRHLMVLSIAMQGCMDSNVHKELKRFAEVLSQLLSAGADLEAVDDEV